MADKKFTIGIETTANTAGAEEAGNALDDVAKKGGDVDKSLKQADGKELKSIKDNAGPAVGSLRQLEDEVEKLHKALRDIPVGSAQFTALSARVKDAKANLALAETEARKLGATVARRGNTGLAVQEFARGLEDAQYGLRGIQNNIPSLVLALGGGPGLAGVLSIAAVAGGVLWELMSDGTKKAKGEAVDYLEIFKKLSSEFGNTALDIEKARGANADANLAKQKEYATAQQRIADAELTLEKQRIKGDGGVAVAKARLDLSRTETALLTASGEAAVKLTKERENTLKRIVALEKESAELIRLAEERSAQAKVAAAQGAVGNATQSKDAAAGRSTEKNQDLTRVADQLANAMEERLKTLRDLGGQRDAAIQRQKESSDPLESLALAGFIDSLAKAIEAAAKNPSAAEAELTVKRTEAEAAAKEAADNFKKASDDQKSAAEALKAATAGLDSLRNSQNQDRQAESGLGQIAEVGNLDSKLQVAGQKTATDIGQVLAGIITGLGEKVAAEPGVKSALARVKSLAADGVQADEQNEVVRLVGGLVQQIKSKDVNTVKLFQDLLNAVNNSVTSQSGLQGQITALNNRINTLTATAGQRNP